MLRQPANREQVLEEVRRAVAAVRAYRHAGLVAIDEETRLADLGISSLDLAEVVSTLESVFDVDPFAEAVAITSITDVRSLCDAYLGCLSPGPKRPDELDRELRAIRGRTDDTGRP